MIIYNIITWSVICVLIFAVVLAINYSKETKADFLGLGNYIYLNHYKKWKKIKDNFDLKNIVVKLEVNNNLLRNENTDEGTRKVHE